MRAADRFQTQGGPREESADKKTCSGATSEQGRVASSESSCCQKRVGVAASEPTRDAKKLWQIEQLSLS